MQHFGFANGFDCEDGEDCKCYKSFNQTGTNNDKEESAFKIWIQYSRLLNFLNDLFYCLA